MEVKLNDKTAINKSPKKIDSSSAELKAVNTIKLSGLNSTSVSTGVNTMVKVLKVLDTETVSTGKRKHDVADASGTAKVNLWEQKIGLMSESACYELQCFIVREWNSKKYLSLTFSEHLTKWLRTQPSKGW